MLFNQKSVLIIITFAMTLELISVMTLQFLGLPNTPMPWSFLAVLKHQIYFEPLLSLMISVFVILLGYGIYHGGLMRYLSYMAIVLISCTVLTIGMG